MRRLWRSTAAGWLLVAGALAAACGGGGGGRGQEQGAADAAATPDPAHTVQLLFAYGSEKQDWVEAVTQSFNEGGFHTASGKAIRVEPLAQGSGELIDDVLSGARQPHLASPASEAFIRLG